MILLDSKFLNFIIILLWHPFQLYSIGHCLIKSITFCFSKRLVTNAMRCL